MSLLTALLMSNPALEEVYFPGKYFLARENSRPFLDPTTGFPVKLRLSNDCSNSILTTRHYPDLGSASDWSCRERNWFQPIRRIS